jgi:hypothetical protein
MKATFRFDCLIVLHSERDGLCELLRAAAHYTRAPGRRKFLKFPLVSQRGELLMFVLIRQRFALFAR